MCIFIIPLSVCCTVGDLKGILQPSMNKLFSNHIICAFVRILEHAKSTAGGRELTFDLLQQQKYFRLSAWEFSAFHCLNRIEGIFILKAKSTNRSPMYAAPLFA